MANQLKIELIVDDKGSVTVKQFGENTEEAVKKPQGALQQLKGHWLAAAAATAAAVAIAKDCIAAFVEQEAAEMKLAVAMRNQGDFSREGYAALKDYAAGLQKVTTYGDETTIAMMANLKTYGMSTEELKRATEATMDLASAKGMDLMAASELVGKAFVGETGTLSRYGIVVEEGLQKTEKFDAVLGLIQQRFGGSARAEIETYAGQWKQIANWWGDIKEKVGLGLLKTLEGIQFAVGMVGVAFYTVQETIAKGFRIMFEQLEKLPLIGDKFSGIADHLRTIEGGFRDAKEGALAFADKNLQMATSFTRVEEAAEKMGNGVKAAAGQSAEAVKAAQEAMLASAKSRYDTESAIAKDYYKSLEAEIKNQEQIMKLAGATDSAIMKNTIRLKKEALDEYYDKEKELIELAAKARSDADRAKLSDAAFMADKLKRLDSDVFNQKKEIAGLEKVLDAQKTKEQIDNAKKTAEETKKRIQERYQMERDLYSDLRGYEHSYYDASITMIKNQAETYKKTLIDENTSAEEAAKIKIAIAAWVSQETINSYIKMGQKSDDWYVGAKAAFLKLQQDAMTWGKASYEIVTNFASSASSSLGSLFFDAAKGQLKSFGDYFSSIWDSLLKKVTDILGQMAVEWALKTAGFTFAVATPSISFANTGAGSPGTTAGNIASGVSTGVSLLPGQSVVSGTSTFPGYVSASGATQGGFSGWLSSMAPYAIAASAGYTAGGALASMLGLNQQGGSLGGALGAAGGMWLAAGTAIGGPLGALLGGLAGSVLGGIVGNFFGGSNAGFGSATHTLKNSGLFGGLPNYGTWFQLEGASGPASPSVINAFMTDASNAVQAAYGDIATFVKTLSADKQEAIGEALSTMNISYLPTLEGFLNSQGHIAITRETAGGLEDYVKSIPAYIIGQVAPVISSIIGSEANIPQHKTGLDFVPRDRYLNYADYGETILPANEASAYRAGKYAAGKKNGNENGTVIINTPLIHIGGNLIADKRTFDDFTEKIYLRIDKLQKWSIKA